MKLKSLIVSAALAVLPMLSQAGVVYEWQAVNSEAPRGVTLRLEFKPSVVKSGAFSFDYKGEGNYPDWLPRSIGLISLSFYATGGSDVYFTQDFSKGIPDSYPNALNMSVNFIDDRLVGTIVASSFSTTFGMSTIDGDYWKVFNLESDAPLEPAGCGRSEPWTCGGATGVILRTGEIPEPSSIALFGVGLFAASSLRRRKAQ